MDRKFYPQLDGLRGAAALSILAHHYWPLASRWDPTGGRLGVDFFFVLSGFLITRSLLLARRRPGAQTAGILSNFYAKRARRILPLFYLTLLGAALAGWDLAGRGLLWHGLFLSNLYFILHGHFIGSAGHLWALAVEQHFYLVWPLILLAVPRRQVGAAAAGMILAGVGMRVVAATRGWNSLTIDLMTPSAFESLGAGAWLAGALDERPARLSRQGRWINGMGFSGLLLMALRWACLGSRQAPALSLLGTELSRSLVLAWLIAQGACGLPWRLGRWLESAPARALGRWSFGIYLSHNFILTGLGRHVGTWVTVRSLPFVAMALTLAWAKTGYQWIEKPLLERPGRRGPPPQGSLTPVMQV